jgi:hypothetical protein
LVCPGSGAQAIKDLAVFARYYSGGSGNARCAVYRAADRVLIAYSSAVKAISGGWAWVSWNDTEITYSGSFTSLTGGVAYWLVATGNGTNILVALTTGHTSGDCAGIAADYTGGFPDPIAAGTANDYWYQIKCGVEAAAGGSIVPLAMHHYKLQRRGF